MFYNLRYISVIVFGITSLLILMSGVYFKFVGQERVLYKIGNHEAKAYSSYFQNSIWNKYFPIISYITSNESQPPETIPEYLLLEDEISRLFESKNILNIELYEDGNVIFQMNEMQVLSNNTGIKKILDKQEIKHDLKPGEQAQDVLKDVRVFRDNQYSNHIALRNIYKPYLRDVPEQMIEIFEKLDPTLVVYFDITDEVGTLSKIAYIIIMIVIFSFAAFTGVVFFMSIRAEKIIEKQYETSAAIESARESAEAESKAKSKFLANVSHELRTPLNAIIGFSDIIKSESMGPIENPQYKEFINDINSSGQHLLSLINDILDFSKSEEDKLEVSMEDIDITKLMAISARMVAPRAEESGVTIQAKLPKEHVVMVADPKRMKQVLLNLLSNAVKFTPSGGNVTIESRTESGILKIIITDTGVGMEPQDLAKALSPFGQVDNKLSKRYEGTGLGLPLTKKLVELMNGNFDIQSETGLGTTITLSFQIRTEKDDQKK